MSNRKDPERSPGLGHALGIGLALGLTPGLALADNLPVTTTLPNGAELSVQIDNPADNEENRVPANANGLPGGTIDVGIDGEASVGQGDPDITLVYVLDVSGSTIINNCDANRTILTCEVEAIINVDNDPNITSVDETGIAIFADGGNTADMSGDAGDQPLIDPNEAPTNRVETVANSAFSDDMGGAAGLSQFQLRTVGAGETDFSQGMDAATAILGGAANGTLRVIFLSDGISSQANAPGGFGGALGRLVATGAVVDTFAVGPSSECNPAGDSPTGELYQISDATGGTCTPVPDPATLPALLPDLLFTELTSVQVAVDATDVPTNTNPVLPADGPVTATYDATATLGVGTYAITATAEGRDNAGSDTVTAEVTKQVLQLIASPLTATNELSEDNSHTVYGQILGGTGPDRNIDFAVGGQNAATATPPNGSVSATPGGAAVSFDYTVPGNECDSLGQDTITVSTTIAGMPDSVVLTKDWVDTIPPVATCDPDGNPHGNVPKAPGKGGQGQNQDGFYVLGATDNLSGESCAPLQISVADDGSDAVFGPFLVGTVIKYTQAPGATPVIKKMGGGKADNVDWHIIGNGDAVVTAVDQSGNTSDPVSCLVPPPPK